MKQATIEVVSVIATTLLFLIGLMIYAGIINYEKDIYQIINKEEMMRESLFDYNKYMIYDGNVKLPSVEVANAVMTQDEESGEVIKINGSVVRRPKTDSEYKAFLNNYVGSDITYRSTLEKNSEGAIIGISFVKR